MSGPVVLGLAGITGPMHFNGDRYGDYVYFSLFGLGLLTVATRRNAVAILMGVELILNAAALNFVAREEAPLGIVYETDARAEPKVKIISTFGEGLHPPVIYPAAVVKGAKPGAAAYLAFLSSSQARAVFQRYGFTPLN